MLFTMYGERHDVPPGIIFFLLTQLLLTETPEREANYHLLLFLKQGEPYKNDTAGVLLALGWSPVFTQSTPTTLTHAHSRVAWGEICKQYHTALIFWVSLFVIFTNLDSFAKVFQQKLWTIASALKVGIAFQLLPLAASRRTCEISQILPASGVCGRRKLNNSGHGILSSARIHEIIWTK